MDSAENKPLGALSMDDAVTALMGEPSPTEDPSGQPEVEEVTESEETENTKAEDKKVPRADVESEDQPEEPAEEESAEDEAQESEEDEEVEEEESEDTDGEAEPDESEEETEPVYTLEDGTEVDLTELKRGYLRQADYTQKTQAVAEARKEVEAQVQQRQQERQILAENLSLALSVVEPQLAELAATDWDALASSDAYEYAEKRALWDQAQVRYNKLTEQAQSVVQAEQAQREQQRKAVLAQEAEKLKMAMPDIADPSKGKQLKSALAEYAREIGLSEQEARTITDHRLILMMDKARRFDELSKGGLELAKKKVSNAPKRALKAGKPKSATERQQANRKQQEARLRQSGKLEDAVALLMS